SRSASDLDVAGQFDISPAAASFSQIRSDRIACPADLAGQSKTLRFGKPLGSAIDLYRERMGLLPNFQIFVIPQDEPPFLAVAKSERRRANSGTVTSSAQSTSPAVAGCGRSAPARTRR